MHKVASLGDRLESLIKAPVSPKDLIALSSESRSCDRLSKNICPQKCAIFGLELELEGGKEK